MELNQIRYMLALCDELNFTRAAERCGVSQPSLTNGIRSLEEALGGALFERKPSVRLLPLGVAMRPHFETVIRELAKAERKASTRRARTRPRRSTHVRNGDGRLHAAT